MPIEISVNHDRLSIAVRPELVEGDIQVGTGPLRQAQDGLRQAQPERQLVMCNGKLNKETLNKLIPLTPFVLRLWKDLFSASQQALEIPLTATSSCLTTSPGMVTSNVLTAR